jgi:hypothetical protein
MDVAVEADVQAAPLVAEPLVVTPIGVDEARYRCRAQRVAYQNCLSLWLYARHESQFRGA